MSGAKLAFFISIIAGLHWPAASQNATVTYVTVKTLKLTPTIPSPLPFKYGESKFVTFNYSIAKHNVTIYPNKGWIVSASVDNSNVANIIGPNTFYINFKQPTGNITLEVKGDNAGRSHLRFQIQDWVDYPFGASMLSDSDQKIGTQIYTDVAVQMYVTMQTRTIDTLFNVVVFLLVITANIGMGTQVDLNIVKEQLRLPIAPAIGLFSQFVFMPVIAFGVAVGLEVEPGIALGLFACGCAPGGLASNIFTYLLHGNVSLSITMTLVSTLASLGLLPLWLFTLGSYLYRDSDIKIPFRNIIVSLFIIIIPAVVGLYMQAKTPRAALMLIKATKIIMCFFMLFMFTFGAYANWWVLDLVDGKVLFSSAALPYLGFLLGGFAAFVGRRSTPDIVTIAVETGIQNTAVPIVLLRMSLKGPEMTTSIVVPLISSTMTPIPLIIAVIYLEIRDYRHRKREAAQKQETPADQVALKEEGGEVNEKEGDMIKEETGGVRSFRNTPLIAKETQV